MGLITIAEFAKERGQERDTVNTFIRRNLTTVPGITKSPDNGNRVIDTDSEAYRILNQKYPKLETLEIITAEKMELEAAIAELAEKREMVDRMQAMISRYQEKTEELENAVQRLLQDKEASQKLIGEATEQRRLLSDRESRLELLEEKAAQVDVKTALIEEKERQLSEEKSRGEQQQERIVQLQAELLAKEKEIERYSKMGFWQRLFGF